MLLKNSKMRPYIDNIILLFPKKLYTLTEFTDLENFQKCRNLRHETTIRSKQDKQLDLEFQALKNELSDPNPENFLWKTSDRNYSTNLNNRRQSNDKKMLIITHESHKNLQLLPINIIDERSKSNVRSSKKNIENNTSTTRYETQNENNKSLTKKLFRTKTSEIIDDNTPNQLVNNSVNNINTKNARLHTHKFMLFKNLVPKPEHTLSNLNPKLILNKSVENKRQKHVYFNGDAISLYKPVTQNKDLVNIKVFKKIQNQLYYY